jgi:WD40 repeat protein
VASILRVIDLQGRVIFEESRDFFLDRGAIAWSPDGTQLAWGDRRAIKIRRMDPAGELTRLRLPALPRAGTDGSVYALGWSPDGDRFLVNVSTDAEGHSHAIVSVAADGSGDVVMHSRWRVSLEWSHGFSWQPT